MAELLIRNIHTLVTMDAKRRVLRDADIRLEDGRVAEIGSRLPARPGARELDGRNCAAYPGFVNTHHHLYQTLTRNIPRVQNAKLFDWLVNLYEVWRELGPEAVEVSTRVGVGELLLSGCTTTTDHFYVFPRGAPQEFLDIEIETARKMGVRFHPTRGSMSRGRSQGGLPPDDVVQTPDEILADCDRLISKYHDPKPFAMCRIVLAPCSPFSVTTELLAETSQYARTKGVFLHTHLCETKDEEDFCQKTLGLRPLDYMEKTGWVGPDVWYAHGIYFSEAEIKRLAETRTGVAHCPASNLRLGSGIAPIPKMLEAGVRVGLAVDGSASNDASNMVREMQLAMLVHRVGTGVEAMPPQKVVEMATLGGAAVLGQPEIGSLEPGKAADLALFRLDRLDYAGAMADPASALLFCGAGPRAEYTIVAGRVLVEKGRLVGEDEEALTARANAVAERMLRAAEEKRGVLYR
ncbi:MAG TPA: 8-oxoguanine deaminase [Kiritimatiellia bacterium]|nr:8-oxoguanine deaminase [Kiritimatiellia bacterium]HRZ11094.1 8-oxoguanine deaminase [Kiritimatiellia bacterium]HSA19734.1 8-oxoguanine deaminase [Kiritimatiellia bacterium]